MSDKSRCPMCFSNDDHTPQCLNRNYESDLRAQIAADIRAEMNQPRLIELADRHEGYYQGQRTGLERAARIAEKGTTK